jgi:hypothetical protein
MTDSYKSELPDEVLLTLGQIAAEMSTLEQMLQFVLWHMLGLHGSVSKGLAITGPLQLNQKVELFRALVALEDEPFKARALGIATLLDNVRPERNRKLHAVYGVSEERIIAITLGSDRRSLKETDVKLEDLRTTRDEIVEARDKLIRCYLSKFGEPYSSPQKPE